MFNYVLLLQRGYEAACMFYVQADAYRDFPYHAPHIERDCQGILKNLTEYGAAPHHQ